MVGAGIFSLLGAAGEVAGAAVWVSFAIAGAIALLQGYSFGKLGARYPSAGGLLEYVAAGFGQGHVLGVTAWLVYAANAIVTAMVAVSFGSYASSSFADGDAGWIKVFSVLVIVAMTLVNVMGSRIVARARSRPWRSSARSPDAGRRRRSRQRWSRAISLRSTASYT